MYNHFESGDALMRAVAREGDLLVLETLKGAVRGEVDPREQLRRLAHGARAWALANPGLYQVMARVQPNPTHPDAVPYVRDMLDLFERPLGQLGVPTDQRLHAIRSVRSTIHGFVLLETSGQFQMGGSLEESFAWAVECLIRGVEADES